MKQVKISPKVISVESRNERKKRLRCELRERDKQLNPYGRIKYDVEQVKKLAGMQCSKKEIAAVLGMAESTFYLHLKYNPEVQRAYDEGKESGKAALRMKQYSVAMTGNVPMLIHLGKNMLEQFDRQKVDQTVTQTQPVLNLVLPGKKKQIEGEVIKKS